MRCTVPTSSTTRTDASTPAATNPVRGAAVVARGRQFLDEHTPLAAGSHTDVTSYRIADGALVAETPNGPQGLAEPGQFAGFRGAAAEPESVLLVHHGLHVRSRLTVATPSARATRPVSRTSCWSPPSRPSWTSKTPWRAVDAADKVAGYRNWLQLMQGTLTADVEKGGRTYTRRLNADRVYTAPDGSELILPGRSLLLIRQVGHLMTSDAVLDASGAPVPEEILDALFTTLGSVHDLRGPHAGHNSRAGSVYIVKPKMHGPGEVAVACALLAGAEAILGLEPLTLKIGIMDEERRTSANLKACIWEARERVAFINTGFLDRTGDEIHTSRCWPPHGPQGRHARLQLDQGLRGRQRRHRAGVRLQRAGPDWQGHVGGSGQHGGHAQAEGRPPARRCRLRLGPLTDSRDAARHPLPPGRCGRRQPNSPGSAARHCGSC